MAAPVRLIIDTDPGIDDALALALAVTSPEVDLLAVTTVAGNAPVEEATDNALRLLRALGGKTFRSRQAQHARSSASGCTTSRHRTARTGWAASNFLRRPDRCPRNTPSDSSRRCSVRPHRGP